MVSSGAGCHDVLACPLSQRDNEALMPSVELRLQVLPLTTLLLNLSAAPCLESSGSSHEAFDDQLLTPPSCITVIPGARASKDSKTLDVEASYRMML